MSVESVQEFSADLNTGSGDECKKHLKISYTREFLLSFSELDVCKLLPKGYDKFDTLLIKVLEDSSHRKSEWQRVSDGAFLNSKCNEHDKFSSNHSSGRSLGRWDTRSVSNNRTVDVQSIRESGTSWQCGSLSQRSWHYPEHKGLLGSGVFTNSSGCSIRGPTDFKLHGSCNYQQNKSSEPYQAPHSYKRNEKDILNDETFGSLECSPEERAEEERKRRASFEVMRKEQQKTLQEMRNFNSVKEIIQSGTDNIGLFENSEAERTSTHNLSRSHEEMVSRTNFDMCSLPIQVPTSARPVVPPGFSNVVLEMKTECPVSSNETEMSCIGEVDNSIRANDIMITDNFHEDQHVLSRLGTDTHDIAGPTYPSGPWIDSGIADFGANALSFCETEDSANRCTSILEKLFGSGLAASNGDLSLAEQQPSELQTDVWNSEPPSSTLAHWFLDKDSEVVMDLPSSKSNGLLSLINDKNDAEKFIALDGEAVKQLSETTPLEQNLIPGSANSCVPGPQSGVLTCEDLEQVILAEANKCDGHWVADRVQGEVTAVVDKGASCHLLSLLQKGAKDIMPATVAHAEMGSSVSISEGVNADVMNGSAKALTLETLFGSAFISELHNGGAPLSLKRGSVEPNSDGCLDGRLRLDDFETTQSNCSDGHGNMGDEMVFKLPQEEGLICSCGDLLENTTSKADKSLTAEEIADHVATINLMLKNESPGFSPSQGSRTVFRDPYHSVEQTFLHQHSYGPHIHHQQSRSPDKFGIENLYHPPSLNAFSHTPFRGSPRFEPPAYHPMYHSLLGNYVPLLMPQWLPQPTNVPHPINIDRGCFTPELEQHQRASFNGLIVPGPSGGDGVILESMQRFEIEGMSNIKRGRLPAYVGRGQRTHFPH